jgi:disulfide bond formation protein DsbB
MTCPFTLLKKVTPRLWGVLFLFVSLAVVGAALISQYGFGLHPCKLCIWQRWPFALSAVLSLMLIALHKHRIAVLLLLVALALTFLGNAGLAFFHVGVEYHWWIFASDCTASAIKKGVSVQEMLEALKAAPMVRCDERVPFLFGMTMAFYNVLVCLGLSLLALMALIVQRKRD